MANPRHSLRRVPYLQRNWKVGIQAAAIAPPNVSQSFINDDSNEHDECPSDRYRSDGAADSGIADDVLLHEGPSCVQPAMRVDVIRVFHRDRTHHAIVSNSTLDAATKSIETQARCKITVTTPGHISKNAQVLYCDSQICRIRSTLDAAGTCDTAKVHLQPFLIPEEKLYIERHDDFIFYLADTYTIKVELQSADSRNWPPLNLAYTTMDGLTSLRHWTLSAEISNILERTRRLEVLKLSTHTDSVIKTDFLMEIDVRWATLLPPKQEREGKQDTLLTYIGQEQHENYKFDKVYENSSYEVNGYMNGSGYSKCDEARLANCLEDDLDERAEGELTPSRSLRARNSTNYNLKDLSAKAQGKQPRRRLRVPDDQKRESGARVTYRLPKEVLPVTELVVDRFSCCICHVSNQSFLQLQAHLLSHSQFEFEINANSGRLGHQLDVTFIFENIAQSYRPKVYQLGKALVPFDLDKYIEGDNSWATSRLGPNDGDEIYSSAKLRKGSQARPLSTKPVQRTGLGRKARKIYVPHTEQLLFNPLSKAQLMPGAEVRHPGADESWLIQKHRDVVHDYSDLSSSEKEYIKEWDAFIQNKHIVSEAFIDRAVIDFVKDKMGWLLDRTCRLHELGKHVTVLVARGLDDNTIKMVRHRIQEARAQRSTSRVGRVFPSAPMEGLKRISGGCAFCGRLVRGPGLLNCSNEGCKKLYHKDCMRVTARVPISELYWRCNDCIG